MSVLARQHTKEQKAKQTQKVTAEQIYLELRQNPSPTLNMVNLMTQQTSALLATRLRGWH